MSVTDVPAVTTMLHFDQDKEYHCNRAYEVVGISTLEFTNNFTHPTYGNYDIKYYWTGGVDLVFKLFCESSDEPLIIRP